MANWIKMQVTLPDNPKVLRIARAVSIDRFAAAGRCLALWAWAQSHSTSGRVQGMGLDEVDALVVCKGFAEAMKGVGWLDERGGAIVFPRWELHNGTGAKTRAIEQRKKQRQRDRNTGAVPDSVPRAAGQARDQIREEKSINHPSIPHTKNSCALPLSDGAADAGKDGEISLSGMDGWMQEAGIEAGKSGPNAVELSPERMRSVLRRLGIRGENLERLAASGLTVAAVREELGTIDADREVRNKAAVLTVRLMAAAGLTTGRMRLTPEDRAAVERLEALRRTKRIGGGE